MPEPAPVINAILSVSNMSFPSLGAMFQIASRHFLIRGSNAAARSIAAS